MKTLRILSVLAVLASFTAFTSCSDSDDDGGDVITNPVINDETAISTVNGVYSHWQPLSSSFSFVIESNSNKFISFEGEESEAGPLNSRFEQRADTWYQVKIFNHLLLGIANDNENINLVADAFNRGLVTQAGYNAAIGKAKFLRALAYLYLVQLWGEVPVFTENGGNTTERKSIDEVYNQIVADLTDAESLLLDYDGDPITPSKQAAQALLARAYLNWGYNPLTADQVQAIAESTTDPDPETFGRNTGRLEEAAKYAKKVIDSGKLKLAADFADLYGVSNESNKHKDNEHLFTIKHDGDNLDAQGNHQSHCAWTFPFQNGQNGQDFTENHTEVADIDLYDDWKKAQPKDNRLDVTYLIKIFNPEDEKYYDYYAPYYTPINGKGVDQKSYYNSVNEEIKLNSIDRIEIRYAEVLLTYAEAQYQLGNAKEGVPYFNQLRTRAGIETVTDLSFDDIKREWDYEFTYEQKSLLNTYRWKNLISSVQEVSHYTHFKDERFNGEENKDLVVEGYSQPATAFFKKIYKHLHAKYDNVRGRHYRQPIPTGLTGEDLHLTPSQNPGY